MINEDWSRMAANAISHAAEMTMHNIGGVVYEYGRPSVVWKPKLFRDGDQWCALYGGDIQEGVAGFGDSPSAAMLDFDRSWNTPIKAQP